MLKNKLWIVALFAALTIAFFGCTEMGAMDDGSQPKPSSDLVIEGKDIVLKACGSSSANVIIAGNKATLNGNNTGFYFDFPDAAAEYAQVQVFFKIDAIIDGRPGLLIKRNTQFQNPVGISSNEDPAYQLNDAATSGAEGFPIKPGFNFTVGMEFSTGVWKTLQFENQMAFQNQIYNPTGNSNANWTVEVLKIVFPGETEAEIVFDADGGLAVPSIVVDQGEEIGDLPVATKAGAVFAGWYTTTTPETEVLSDYVVPLVKTLTLKAKWATTGVTVTAKSIIHAYPAFTPPSPANAITVNADGSATFAMPASWPSVKYMFPTQVVTANGSGTLNDPFTYKYNLVELTVNVSEDIILQTQQGDGTGNGDNNGNIGRYPSGNEVLSLKKGVNKFSLALSDTGRVGLGLQNKTNEANKDGTVVTIVSAVFTEGTMYKVSFDRSVPLRNTDVPTQTIISGRQAKKPADPTFYLDGIVHDFEGWYLDNKPYDFSTAVVTADIDLVSKFGAITQRVISFNVGGGTFTGAGNKQGVNVGATNPKANDTTGTPAAPIITWPVKTADPDGAGAFAGWWDVSVTPIVQYHNGTSALATEITKDTTLTARWLPAAAKVFAAADLHALQSGGYGAVATETDGEWAINGNGWQMLRLDLGAVYANYDYPTISIVATLDTNANQFRVRTYDGSGTRITENYTTPATTSWTYNINYTGAVRYISIENEGNVGAVTITITSITFNLP